jgi:hypothetical protein
MSWYSVFQKSLPTLLKIGGTAYGAYQASKANEAAAQNMQAANNRMIQQQQANQAQSASGLSRVQDIIRRGSALTPYQKSQIDDARRQTVNAMSASGLRGSGRATVAAVRNVEENMKGRFMDANQQRADNAATGLSQQYFNTSNNISNGLINQGNISAGQTLSNASIRGQAIGDIGAVIADEIRQKYRPTSQDQDKPSEV